MRVVLVTESFPPDINGVAHSALRTAEHLARRGHDVLVVAPEPKAPPATESAPESAPGHAPGPAPGHAPDPRGGASGGGPPGAAAPGYPFAVVRLPSVPLPGYPQVRLARPGRRRLTRLIAGFRPDLVHLAGPFVLGAQAAAVARRLALPCVAVYQTDIGGYARAYRVGGALGEAVAWKRIRDVHAAAARTLAPSTPSAQDLTAHGVPHVHVWPRGVDPVRFHPAHRDERLRRRLAPNGELLVGYVGRLAPEKRVDLLADTAALPGVRVVVVGDGPSESSLRVKLPGVTFLGRRTGDELARIYASLDVFAHTGPLETFCQTVQEAMASGVPVVAPAAGGPLDLVAHRRTGLLVPPRDSAAVARAVGELLDGGSELRARFGAAARAEVASRTWDHVGDLLLAHYTAVLASRAPSAAPSASLTHAPAGARPTAPALPPAPTTPAARTAVPGGPAALTGPAGGPGPGAYASAPSAAPPEASRVSADVPAPSPAPAGPVAGAVAAADAGVPSAWRGGSATSASPGASAGAARAGTTADVPAGLPEPSAVPAHGPGAPPGPCAGPAGLPVSAVPVAFGAPAQGAGGAAAPVAEAEARGAHVAVAAAGAEADRPRGSAA